MAENDSLPGIVIASADAVFSVLCEYLLKASERVRLLACVSFGEVLDTVRQRQPDVILLDIDFRENEEMRQVAAKLALVSDAKLVLASGYLAHGAPDLNHLLQHVEAVAVLKPLGSSSLSLAGADGEEFLATLEDVCGTAQEESSR